jgi:hypothetical protein
MITTSMTKTMKKLGLAVALFAAFAAIGCGSKAPSSDKPASAAGDPAGDPAAGAGAPADSCTAAEDCALVDACCGCSAGGKKIAIRKDAVTAFESTREQRCGEVMCAQMMSQDPSCDAEAICGSRNRCRVAPHMQQQK